MKSTIDSLGVELRNKTEIIDLVNKPKFPKNFSIFSKKITEKDLKIVDEIVKMLPKDAKILISGSPKSHVYIQKNFSALKKSHNYVYVSADSRFEENA